MPRNGAAQRASFGTLYSFQGSLDGGQPMGGVVIGQDSVLYGTTYFGGTSGDGTVFELIPAKSAPWKINVLHNFSGADGRNCAAALVFGSTGAIYGTTTGGTLGAPDGNGAVFQLAPPSTAGGAWTETVLWNSGLNGNLNGTLAIGPTGTLYATTQGDEVPITALQYGTVDAVSPPATAGGTWTGRIIYNLE